MPLFADQEDEKRLTFVVAAALFALKPGMVPMEACMQANAFVEEAKKHFD